MLTIKILGCIFEFLLWFFIVMGFFVTIRDAKYQKKWRLKKRTLVSMNPAISRAELCEKYVTFCIQNHCKVDF